MTTAKAKGEAGTEGRKCGMSQSGHHVGDSQFCQACGIDMIAESYRDEVDRLRAKLERVKAEAEERKRVARVWRENANASEERLVAVQDERDAAIARATVAEMERDQALDYRLTAEDYEKSRREMWEQTKRLDAENGRLREALADAEASLRLLKAFTAADRIRTALAASHGEGAGQ